MNRKAPIIVVIMAVILSACRMRDNDFSYYTNFDGARWAFTDTLQYVPEMNDSVVEGALLLCVRHSAAYPYSNLWLEVEYATGDSTVRTDTVEMRLSDDFGRWYGKGTGVSYQLADTVYPRFKAIRHRPVKIRNIMRCDTLEDIEQFGIMFQPARVLIPGAAPDPSQTQATGK